MPERHLKAVPDPEQPPLPVEPAPPRPHRRVCAWCGQRATTTIMIAPPAFTSRKGRRILTKPGTYADACREHRRNAYNPYAQPAANRKAVRAERRRLELATEAQLTISDAPEPEDPAS